MIDSLINAASFVAYDKYTVAATSNLDIYTELSKTVHEHVTADMRCAVARDSIETGERLGYVAGLAENAGTWKVAMTFDSAVAEADRLNSLDDGCQYWAVCYKGLEQ